MGPRLTCFVVGPLILAISGVPLVVWLSFTPQDVLEMLLYACWFVLVGGLALVGLMPSPAASRFPKIRRYSVGSRPVTIWRRVNWVLLASAPASLVLSTLTFITTEVSPIPFLIYEAIPLYLLSFAMAFTCWPVCWTDWPHKIILVLAALFIPALFIFASMEFGDNPISKLALAIWLALCESGMILPLVIPVLTFVVTALACHGELARDQPGGLQLVEFGAWILAGVTVGLMFNWYIAPAIFTYSIVELPLALVVACVAVFSCRLEAMCSRSAEE